MGCSASKDDRPKSTGTTTTFRRNMVVAGKDYYKVALAKCAHCEDAAGGGAAPAADTIALVPASKPPAAADGDEFSLTSEVLDWIEDEKNVVIVLNTVQLFTGNKSRASLGTADPYLRVTTTASDAFTFTSPVRSNMWVSPEWVLRVPILVRPDTDDVISIQVWDDDLFTADDKLAEIRLSTHRLLELHGDATRHGKDLLEIEGCIVGVVDRENIRVNLTTELQAWDTEYKTIGGHLEPSKHWDAYIRLLMTATRFTASKFIDDGANRATAIRPPDADDTGDNVKTLKIIDGKAEIMAEDKQVPIGFASSLFFKYLNSMSFKATAADSTYFTDRVQAEAYVQQLLGEVHASLICSEGSWGNVVDDATFTRFLFSNNGSSFVERIDGGYVCRMSHLGKYDVRPGFERYGCDAYFDEQARPVRIEREEEVITPDDDQWVWAKLQARTSAFIGCSGVHLIKAHYLWASIPNIAMSKCLAADHPIRRLLHVHYFRSANTCLNSMDTLIPERGLVHRGTGFEYKGLVTLFHDILDDFPWMTFPDEMKARGHEPDDGHYPMCGDGLDYHGVLSTYVGRYLRLYYETDADLAVDCGLKDMVEYIGRFHKGIAPPQTIEAAVDILAELIFRVTGYHQHVGNVNVSGTSPVMISDHLSKDHQLAAIESTTILAVVTALTAGMLNQLGDEQYPGIMDDWSHLLLDHPARIVFKHFQNDLKDLKERIEKRNKIRQYTFNDFNPQFVKLSVSS